MGKLPIKKNGFASPVSGDDEDLSDIFIETYNYKGKEYDLIYKSMDPNKNEMITIKPEVAKTAIKEFIECEIGGYLDNEFNLTNKHINNKLKTLKEGLETHIKEKIDMIAEEIVTEIVTSNFRNAVGKKVSEKLEKMKNLLDE